MRLPEARTGWAQSADPRLGGRCSDEPMWPQGVCGSAWCSPEGSRQLAHPVLPVHLKRLSTSLCPSCHRFALRGGAPPVPKHSSGWHACGPSSQRLRQPGKQPAHLQIMKSRTPSPPGQLPPLTPTLRFPYCLPHLQFGIHLQPS